VSTLCCEHGMSGTSHYIWRTKFGTMDASVINRLKKPARNNTRHQHTALLSTVWCESDLLPLRGTEHDTNKIIADSLIALSLCPRTWGSGLMLLHEWG
ncbi:MAG: hypothetical protein RLZZ502_754, partial [Pseudomonadota bacterium]